MKIGTITFHWGTNYGAVIQAYALQRFLINNDYETEIIQYLPWQNILLRNLIWFLKGRLKSARKEIIIEKFRKEKFSLSRRRYYSNRGLFRIKRKYSHIICGSDQVWNFSFLEYAERGRITPSYYLNFVDSQVRRISYATSFGTDVIPTKFINVIKDELIKFKHIGVRENTAKYMLEGIGVESQVVVDPTVLLEKQDYDKLLEKAKISHKFDLFSFVLHEEQELAEQCKQYILSTRKEWRSFYNDEVLSVEEWLFNEKNARLVLTNSFHSTVFAILFHTPFIVLPVKGSNMNNRIETLLSLVGLEENYLQEFDSTQIERLLQQQIDWEQVDSKLDFERKKSQQFLLKSLEKCD